MIYRLYSIRDLKGDWWTPRFAMNDDAARRDLSMAVNETGNLISFAPNDFELYFVGTFNTCTGFVSPVDLPEFICRADDLIGVK